MSKRPKGVSCYFDRHRKLWWKFRAKGRKTVQTRALFDSVEWWAWYNAAVNGEAVKPGAGAERTGPGSIDALAVAFYTSADWKGLSKTTQVTYRGIIDRFRLQHGQKPFRPLQAHHIRGMLDARADTPAAANNLLKVLRALFRFAVDRNLVAIDPTIGVKPLRYKTDGFHTWTEDEISTFDARWPLGTQERLAKDLLLYTAQRSSDVRVMGAQHVKAGVVKVRQQKTGTTLEIRLHTALRASLDARQVHQLTFITTPTGEPYTAAGFGNWFSDAARKAGLPVGVSAHGLRKAAARRLAEAGCTASEIAAITGHRTLKEVSRYTQAADQRTLANAAMKKVGGTEDEHNVSNLGKPVRQTGGK